MTKQEASQFNKMLVALRRISCYESPEQLHKGQYGLGYEEVLEMSYENVLNEAKNSIADIKAIDLSTCKP